MEIALPKWIVDEQKDPSIVLDFYRGKCLLKVQGYKKKVEIYSSKYKMDFEDFEKKVLSSNKENMGEWDDYIIWKGYHLSFKKWHERLEEISECSKLSTV